MVSRLVKVMELMEEKLRTESYNGYAGGVWEADDPVSAVINEKSQDLLLRLKKLTEVLESPSAEVATDMAEGFYLLFSAMHALLLHPYVTWYSCFSFLSDSSLWILFLKSNLIEPNSLRILN